MKKAYRIYLTAVASTVVNVEIDDTGDPDDNREAALDKAYEQMDTGMCWRCSEKIEFGGEWIAGNWTPGRENLDENVEEVTS